MIALDSGDLNERSGDWRLVNKCTEDFTQFAADDAVAAQASK